MTDTNQLTVEGWVMNAYPITILAATSDLVQHQVIELFTDTFTDSNHQRLSINPQPILVAYQSTVARTKFSLAFLQRVEVTATIETWPVPTNRALAESKHVHQAIIVAENNWRDKTLRRRLRLYLKQLNNQLALNQTGFLTGQTPFATYQTQQLALVQIVGGHLLQHLQGLQHRQRRLWGEYAAKAQAHTRPLAVFTHGRLQQIWPGPTTIETTPQPDGSVQFTRRSKLPLVNIRRVGNLAYQDQLLQPLRRGYQQWVRAGRPTDPPADLPPLLAPAFALWQQAHRSSDHALRSN